MYGAIPEEMCICHYCDNPSCVRPSHLFLGTRDDNQKDSVAKGRMALGEKNGSSKLVASDVYEIRRLYATGRTSHRKLAKMWKISHAQIGDIIRRKSWRHI